MEVEAEAKVEVEAEAEVGRILYPQKIGSLQKFCTKMVVPRPGLIESP